MPPDLDHYRNQCNTKIRYASQAKALIKAHKASSSKPKCEL